VAEGDIAGLATSGGPTILVTNDVARHRASAAKVIHHEIGHKIDFATEQTNGRIDFWNAEIWGKGATVSQYAKTNAMEDFAETHQHVLKNWDAIMADPERHVWSNGELGQKYRAIIEDVYKQRVPRSKE
jgi:hypothetical protein